MKKTILILAVCHLSLLAAVAQDWSNKYTTDHPLIIVGDWDKPPYEFLNEKGNPAGSNIDIMNAIMEELNIPYKYVLKEWSNAIKTFERNDADLILANANRYRNGGYFISDNIINYNRIRAASAGDSIQVISHKQLINEGVVLKPGDYSAFFFHDIDSLQANRIEFQSPKVALTGLLAGDYKYFVWGEEPLRWKIRELNLEGIVLNDVSLPVSEIYIIGHNQQLIEDIDDHYSRLKQSGQVELINDRWCHPERIQEKSRPIVILIILALLVLGGIIYLFSRLAKKHVENVTRSSTDLNDMMYKALHMGNFNVMQYDIANNQVTNRYGNIVPQPGLTLEEFISRIHPDQQQEFSQKMQLLMSGRERRFELNKRWNAGTVDEPHWLNFHGHAISELNNEGKPAYIINAIHDVTHEVEEDNAAHELVKKYECLLNIPSVAMSFYSHDGWLITLNDSMKHLCGFNPNDSDAERYWRSLNMFDIPLFKNALSTDARDKLLVCQHMYYPDIKVNRYIEFHVIPLINAEGKIANYFDATIEMTEKRERIHTIYHLQREYNKTVERIAMQKERLTYLLRNGERYLMRSDQRQKTIAFFRTIGTPEHVHSYDEFLEMLVPEQRESVHQILTDNVTTTSQVFEAHLLKQTEDGFDGFLRITFNPVFDEEGHIVGHEGISSDITTQRNTQKRLSEEVLLAADSMRLKSGFMASMTHELRTPLNAIVGFTSVVEALGDSEERGEYVRIIRNSTDMLQRLINDILEVSSFTDGPTSVELADVDFAKSFDDICLTLRQRVQEPGVEFICENPFEVYLTRLDIGRIQQVVTNFVTNAVKFTHEGHIRLGYRYEEKDGRQGLYIYCEDTGIGIPKEKHAIIFDRFVKLDEFVQGTGMGLAICKSIVERGGGQIGVESEGEGQGTTFWFWIPCEKKAASEY